MAESVSRDCCVSEDDELEMFLLVSVIFEVSEGSDDGECWEMIRGGSIKRE